MEFHYIEQRHSMQGMLFPLISKRERLSWHPGISGVDKLCSVPFPASLSPTDCTCGGMDCVLLPTMPVSVRTDKEVEYLKPFCTYSFLIRP